MVKAVASQKQKGFRFEWDLKDLWTQTSHFINEEDTPMLFIKYVQQLAVSRSEAGPAADHDPPSWT